MYNRYIHNDQGQYTRITEEDFPPESQGSCPSPPCQPQPEHRTSDTPAGFLRHTLDQLHLDSIDSGDLLLLGLLFFLYREHADEELLMALGLLLIL